MASGANPKLNSELAAFFNTGDQPSETEFGYLIDSITPNPVYLPDATSTTLTKDTYQGRTLLAKDLSQNSTFTIEAPAAAGERYQFVFTGDGSSAEDTCAAENHIFTVTTANYEGRVQWINTTDTTATGEARGPDLASSHKTLTITAPCSYEINMISYSTSLMYVWGWVGADATPDFS